MEPTPTTHWHATAAPVPSAGPDRRVPDVMTPTGPHFWVVDAFVDGPFSGNPAGVVLLGPQPRPSAGWMQSVASEVGLSETAFVGLQDSGARSIRWFTPTVEVDICGHATLAAARILFENGARQVEFSSRSGILECRVFRDAIAVDLPADPSNSPVPVGDVERVIGVPVVSAGAGREYVVAEVSTEEQVAGIDPILALVPGLGATGLVVTSRGDGGRDVVCRMFAPQCGIPEDPVTGSAWCALAGWWRARVGAAFSGRQLSRRGGRVHVRSMGDRVVLTGRTRVFAAGRLGV